MFSKAPWYESTEFDSRTVCTVWESSTKLVHINSHEIIKDNLKIEDNLRLIKNSAELFHAAFSVLSEYKYGSLGESDMEALRRVLYAIAPTLNSLESVKKYCNDDSEQVECLQSGGEAATK